GVGKECCRLNRRTGKVVVIRGEGFFLAFVSAVESNRSLYCDAGVCDGSGVISVSDALRQCVGGVGKECCRLNRRTCKVVVIRGEGLLLAFVSAVESNRSLHCDAGVCDGSRVISVSDALRQCVGGVGEECCRLNRRTCKAVVIRGEGFFLAFVSAVESDGSLYCDAGVCDGSCVISVSHGLRQCVGGVGKEC